MKLLVEPLNACISIPPGAILVGVCGSVLRLFGIPSRGVEYGCASRTGWDVLLVGSYIHSMSMWRERPAVKVITCVCERCTSVYVRCTSTRHTPPRALGGTRPGDVRMWMGIRCVGILIFENTKVVGLEIFGGLTLSFSARHPHTPKPLTTRSIAEIPYKSNFPAGYYCPSHGASVDSASWHAGGSLLGSGPCRM